MYRFIDETMVEDDELTARKLLEKLIGKLGPLCISERQLQGQGRNLDGPIPPQDTVKLLGLPTWRND